MARTANSARDCVMRTSKSKSDRRIEHPRAFSKKRGRRVRLPLHQANLTRSETAADVPYELRSTHGTALLETFTAKDGASLRWTEGYRRFLSTLGAIGFCFGAHRRGASAATAFCALGLASLAALGLVLEALVRKKHLFARSKNKLGATLRTLQDLVMVFH